MKIYKTRKEVIEKNIKPTDIVLDVGFWGQAVKRDNPNWLHGVLKNAAQEVYGVDITYDESTLDDTTRYKRASAEDFDFDSAFDVIYASELIEHLSNVGLFLDSCRRNLKDDGKLILTTPNAYSFFSIAEKIFKSEPSVNPDHTMYFNHIVLKKLLEKNGWEVAEQSFIDTFRSRDSIIRWFLYLKHRFLALFTPKYMETLVVIAKKV